MEIKKLWANFRAPDCDSCNKDCGKYSYGNLCSNINYLKNYGEQYYDKMKQSFEELKKISNGEELVVFSFGCGCSLDYIAGNEVFDNNESTYFGVDECEWAIKATSSYKSLMPNMP